MTALRWLTGIAGLLWLSATCHAGAAAPGKVTAGWLETIYLTELPDSETKAKLDTGAETSSINAHNIADITRDGRPWVRFELDLKDRQGKVRTLTLDRPRLRNVLIKERDGKPGRRPVVTLEICFSGNLYQAEFTLADRSEFNYPVLLGRRFLAGVAVVDPQSTYLTQPDCSDRRKAGTGAPGAP
jgi:hypothetical protein